MNTKKITLRKMIDALRYGTRVKQTKGAYKRYIYPNVSGSAEMMVGSACALGKIGLTLDIVPERIGIKDKTGSVISSSIISWNDEFGMTFDQIANKLEERFPDLLDLPIEAEIDLHPLPVVEIDRG